MRKIQQNAPFPSIKSKIVWREAQSLRIPSTSEEGEPWWENQNHIAEYVFAVRALSRFHPPPPRAFGRSTSPLHSKTWIRL